MKEDTNGIFNNMRKSSYPSPCVQCKRRMRLDQNWKLQWKLKRLNFHDPWMAKLSIYIPQVISGTECAVVASCLSLGVPYSSIHDWRMGITHHQISNERVVKSVYIVRNVYISLLGSCVQNSSLQSPLCGEVACSFGVSEWLMAGVEGSL